jgi:hypothetical protein
MPPALAAKFTTAELAVLKVVADEVVANGVCSRSLAEIAARAGCCRSTAQNSLRSAARAGLLTIEERRRRGQKNLPNLIHVVSKEWTAWLARGERRRGDARSPGIGFKTFAPTGSRLKVSGMKGAAASKDATLSSAAHVGERGGVAIQATEEGVIDGDDGT